MKILFFEPYTLAIPHFETALELLQDHIDKNDETYFYYCNADLNFCEANPDHHINVCVDCMSRRKKGMKLIDGINKTKQRVFTNLSGEEKAFIRNFNLSFNTIEDVKEYTFEGVDIGMAVASSLISNLRNPEPDTIALNNKINILFKASFKVYFSFKRTLSELKPDIVYLFNGRMSNLRVLVRLCEQKKITYKIHERGSDKTKYNVYENHLPHSIAAFIKAVKKAWDLEPDFSKKERIAEDFFVKRKFGAEQGWHSYVTNQNLDELPAGWNSQKRNIVIFNSSEDEFAAIGDEFSNPLFKNQQESINYVTDILKNNKDVDIYLRIHPNLTTVNNNSVKNLYEIQTPNFHIIDPGSTISTYKLIDECDVVLSFGSTTGVEATYWNKASVLIGKTFYRDLNVTHNPTSKEELIDLLINTKETKEKIGALMYGYYVATYGISFKHYTPKELFEGTFKETRIYPSYTLSKLMKNKAFKLLAEKVFKKHE